MTNTGNPTLTPTTADTNTTTDNNNNNITSIVAVGCTS